MINSITITHDKVKSQILTSALDGVLGTGVMKPTMGVEGVGDGRSSFLFDGGDFVSIWTPELAARFNGLLGGIVILVKIPAAATWADGVTRGFIRLGTVGGTADQIQLRKGTTVNRVELIYRVNGTSYQVNDTSLAASTDWFMAGITWNKAQDRVRAYLQGVQVGATLTGFASWVGTLDSTVCTLGAVNTTPGSPHIGNLAHAAVTDHEPTAAEMLAIWNNRTGDLRSAIKRIYPIAHWMMDDDSGLVAANEVGVETAGEKFHLNLVHERSPGFADATFKGYQPEDRAEGGYYSCRFQVNSRMNIYKELFERGLGRWIEAWGYGLEPEFEGMITEITFNLPPDRFTISLEPVANMAQMRADVNADGVVDRSTLLQNLLSQSIYPITQLIIGGGEVQGLSVADQAVQQYLNLRAFPKPSMALGGASGDDHLEIFARGMSWTLGRPVYNQTVVTGNQAMTSEVRDILLAKGEYVARQQKEANTTSVAKELDTDRNPWDQILDMTKLGDQQNNRWLPQMTGRRATNAVGRVFLLKQAAPPMRPG